MASDSAPLATHDEAIDKKQDDGADHATEEARDFSGIVPPDSLPKVGRDERENQDSAALATAMFLGRALLWI